jgi:hypothetical protein
MPNKYDKILNIIIQIIKLILFVIGGCFILGFLLNLFGDEETVNISILESISFILMLLIIGSVVIFTGKIKNKYLIMLLFLAFAPLISLLTISGTKGIIKTIIIELIIFMIIVIIILIIIMFAEKNLKKYLISGLLFSFVLSITYLPVLLSLMDEHGFEFLDAYRTVPVVILFITLINFIYIAIIRHSRFRFLNLLLIPINIVLIFFIIPFLPLSWEGNVFAFSLIFLFIPWVILMLITSGIHRYYTRQLTVNID